VSSALAQAIPGFSGKGHPLQVREPETELLIVFHVCSSGSSLSL
jgi:hypothetical protein